MNNRGTQNNTHSRMPTTIQLKLITAYKPNGTIQKTKINALLRPQRKTVMRETSQEIVGECNGPLGLVLKRRKIIIILINLFLWLFVHVLVVCYVTYVCSDPWVLILIIIGNPCPLWGAASSPRATSETPYTKLWCKSAYNLACLYKHVHSIMIWNHNFGQCRYKNMKYFM